MKKLIVMLLALVMLCNAANVPVFAINRLDTASVEAIVHLELLTPNSQGQYVAQIGVIETKPITVPADVAESWQIGDTWRSIEINDMYRDRSNWLVVNDEYAFEPSGDVYVWRSYTAARLTTYTTTDYSYAAEVIIPEDVSIRIGGTGWPMVQTSSGTVSPDPDMVDNDFTCMSNFLSYMRDMGAEWFTVMLSVDNGVCKTIYLGDAYTAPYAKDEQVERMLSDVRGVAPALARTGMLNPGDYIKFGEDHTWQVVRVDGHIATLFYAGCFQGVFDASIHEEVHSLSLMRYHGYGSACWEHSDLRQYLNSREESPAYTDTVFDYSQLAQGMSAMGMSAIIRAEEVVTSPYSGQPGFLHSFSDEEYSLLVPRQNQSIIPYTAGSPGVVGAGEFQGFRADMDALYTDDLFLSTTEDLVFVFSGREIKEYVLDQGFDPFVFTNGRNYPAYWLRDAVYYDLAGHYYYYGYDMLTVSNGTSGHAGAASTAYVRPACCIDVSRISALIGAGTQDDPFTLGEGGVQPGQTQVKQDELSRFEAAFSHPASTLDHELLRQSALASKAVYDEQSIADQLKALGFDPASIEHYDYDTDLAHSVGVTLAHREVTDASGQAVKLYALIMRGTDSGLEWISNFDIGSGDTATGFNRAAIRALGHLSRYIEAHGPAGSDVNNGDYLLWITGHSRAAGAANLIAGRFMPPVLSRDRIYAYTFASPYVSKTAAMDSNIFNFVIDGDFVTNVPLTDWGFTRYGLTIHNSDDAVGRISINAPAEIALMLDFLEAVGAVSQEKFVDLTENVLATLRANAEGVGPAEALASILYAVSTNGSNSTPAFVDATVTLGDYINQMLANQYVMPLLQPLIGAELPNEYAVTLENFPEILERIISRVGVTHSMDTYIAWIDALLAEAEASDRENSVLPGDSENSSNLRMMLLSNETSYGGKISYYVVDGRVYADSDAIARLKNSLYVQDTRVFATRAGALLGQLAEYEVLVRDERHYVDLEKAAEINGLVFTFDDEGKIHVAVHQTPAELKWAVGDIYQAEEYRKWDVVTGPYYAAEAGFRIMDAVTSFDWIRVAFKMATGSYDQENYNDAFTALMLNNTSYNEALTAYKTAESAVSQPLEIINYLEKAANEPDGALAKLCKAAGLSDQQTAQTVAKWGSTFYETMYSSEGLSDMMTMADLYEGLEEIHAGEIARDVFTLINYVSACAAADEMSMEGMKAVFSSSENDHLRKGSNRIYGVWKYRVWGTVQAAAGDAFTKIIDNGVSEAAQKTLDNLGGGSLGLTQTIGQFVFTCLDDTVMHASDQIDTFLLNTILCEMLLEEAAYLGDYRDAETNEELEELQCVAALYLRTVLAIYDNGYFDYEDDKTAVIRKAQNDLARILSFEKGQYTDNYDSSAVIRQLIR